VCCGAVLWPGQTVVHGVWGPRLSRERYACSQQPATTPRTVHQVLGGTPHIAVNETSARRDRPRLPDAVSRWGVGTELALRRRSVHRHCPVPLRLGPQPVGFRSVGGRDPFFSPRRRAQALLLQGYPVRLADPPVRTGRHRGGPGASAGWARGLGPFGPGRGPTAQAVRAASFGLRPCRVITATAIDGSRDLIQVGSSNTVTRSILWLWFNRKRRGQVRFTGNRGATLSPQRSATGLHRPRRCATGSRTAGAAGG
jgi:hypothetical protein